MQPFFFFPNLFFFLNLCVETALFLGLSRHVFSRKDEPRTRQTRPTVFTSLIQLEQLHARACLFFFNCIEKLCFETALFLGLSRHVFSRKDEPRTRKTRPTAFTSLIQLEQLHGARAMCTEKLFFPTQKKATLLLQPHCRWRGLFNEPSGAHVRAFFEAQHF